MLPQSASDQEIRKWETPRSFCRRHKKAAGRRRAHFVAAIKKPPAGTRAGRVIPPTPTLNLSAWSLQRGERPNEDNICYQPSRRTRPLFIATTKRVGRSKLQHGRA